MSRRAIIRTAILTHWRHDRTGRALNTPANDCPSDRQALLPVLNYGPCAHVDTPCAGAGFSQEA